MEKKAASMGALRETLADDQRADEHAFSQAQRALLMGNKDLSQHVMKGVKEGDLEEGFQRAMKKQKAIPSSISVPVEAADDEEAGAGAGSSEKKKKNKKNKHHAGDGGDRGDNGHGKKKRKTEES
jgi:hypothetical protein